MRSPKKGVLGANPTRKRGVLGAGHVKRGVFTAAHAYTGHICEYPHPTPGDCTCITCHLLYSFIPYDCMGGRGIIGGGGGIMV